MTILYHFYIIFISSPFQRGFLVHVLSGTKEDRGLEANSQFETSQQVYQTSEVQNGNFGLRLPLPYRGQLGSFLGPEECLSSRSYPPCRPEVATLQDQGPGLHFSVPPFWSVLGSQGVYQGSQGSRSVAMSHGSESVPIS